MQKLLLNETRINENNVSLKIREEMFNIMAIKNEEQRKIRESLEQEKQNFMEANKNKMEKLEANYK